MKNMRNNIILILLSLLLTTFFAGCFLTPPTNHAPNITSTEVTTATVGEVYSYDVEATDPDGDTLIYTLTAKPPDMTIDSVTGVINWTPDTIGDYDITVNVEDGILNDIQSFSIKVSKSSPTSPPVTPPDNPEEIEYKVVVSAQIDLEVGGVVEVTDESSEIYGTRFVVDKNKFRKNNMNNKVTKSNNVNVFLVLLDALKHQINDYQGFLITPIAVMTDSDDKITGTLEIEYNEHKLSNSGVEKNATVNVYRLKTTEGNMFIADISQVIPTPVEGATWEKVPENKYSDENNIIKISIDPVDFKYYYTLTVTNCRPPDYLGNPLPGDLVYRLSNYGDNDNWLPGHVGIYVGKKYGDKDNDPSTPDEVYNVIEEIGKITTILSGGVIRSYYPDIANFGNGPTYMGAREPINHSFTHINRKIIVDYVESQVGMPYALFETFGVYFGWARGDYVKGKGILASFNCVGLAERAYEIAGLNNRDGLVSDLDEGNQLDHDDPDAILSPQEQYLKTAPARGIIVQNTLPEISDLKVITEGSINTNSSIRITCNASDADMDDLTYIWTKPIFENTTDITFTEGKTISWSTPSKEGVYTISCKVIDNYGGEDEESINISVAIPVSFWTHTITASAGSNGSISPSGDVIVNHGSDKSFTITPDTDYSIADVLVNESSVGAENSYTFTNVTEDHTISASFISEVPALVQGGTAIPWTLHEPENSPQDIIHEIITFWDAYEGANGYRLYRKVNDGSWNTIYQGEGEITGENSDKREYEDFDIQLGNTYEYYVVAYGDGWETQPNFATGPLSQFLPPIYLNSPSDQSTVSDSNITFQWTPLGGIPAGFNGPGKTELQLYDINTNDLIWQILLENVTASSVNFNQDGQATTSLILGNTYGWRVRNYTFDQNMEDVITQSEYWEFTYGTVTGPVHNLTKDTYYDTIQAAIDDADSGNTIEVDDGTYDESIIFPSGRVIILKSLNGSSLTTIRGNDVSATVTLDGSLEGTTLEGFTITHADGLTGRGIYIIHSNLSIENCTISNNHAKWGVGICNWGSTFTITGSTISDNYARSQYGSAFGGGIYNLNGGTLIINESTISGNHVSGGGGYTYYGGSGGGISNGGTLTINESTISDNYAGGEGESSGGGISSGGTLTITGSTISGNRAQCYYGGYGGGIISGGILTITGSTISDNYGNDDGGISLSSSGTFTIGGSNDADKNTICGNYKTGEDPSLDQQIRDDTGSLYKTYKDTNYISAYCE
jgi:hypothetical protein